MEKFEGKFRAWWVRGRLWHSQCDQGGTKLVIWTFVWALPVYTFSIRDCRSLRFDTIKVRTNYDRLTSQHFSVLSSSAGITSTCSHNHVWLFRHVNPSPETVVISLKLELFEKIPQLMTSGTPRGIKLDWENVSIRKLPGWTTCKNRRAVKNDDLHCRWPRGEYADHE